MGHGGARPGAGRKPRTEKYAQAIESLESRIAGSLDERYLALDLLARGGWEQIEEEWLPAALVFVDEVSYSDDGKRQVVKVRAFPDAKADDLVLVKRKRSIAAPDRMANQYLVDRVLGKPAQQIEGEIHVGGADALLARFEGAVEKIYGDADESETES